MSLLDGFIKGVMHCDLVVDKNSGFDVPFFDKD